MHTLKPCLRCGHLVGTPLGLIAPPRKHEKDSKRPHRCSPRTGLTSTTPENRCMPEFLSGAPITQAPSINSERRKCAIPTPRSTTLMRISTSTSILVADHRITVVSPGAKPPKRNVLAQQWDRQIPS